MSARDGRRRHEVHVYRDAASGEWTVASGRRRVSRHRRQTTAVRVGRTLAKRRRVDLAIHARNGRIRSKTSCGNETPRPDGDD